MSKRVFSFHYKVTGKTGEVIDSSEGSEPLSFIEGMGQIVPGLENAVLHLNKGEKKNVTVPAQDAYGMREETLVMKVPKNQLPSQDIKIGDRFRGGPGPEAPVFQVIHVEAETITLDGNHPLAGEDLTFDVDMVEIREATKEELEHGHAHGAGGHSH